MPQALEWTQTALYKDGTTDLLKSMPPLVFMPMPDAPDGSPFLSIDASTTYQQILGFGGEHPPPRSHAPRWHTCAWIAVGCTRASPPSRLEAERQLHTRAAASTCAPLLAPARYR